ncbi:MAG: GNAT family N-acetyltransferase [Planctomycetaceae bacterium]
MTDRQQAFELSGMMAELYREDPPATGQISSEYFQRTISRLLQHPDQGSILLLQHNSDLCGYSILVPYWSNEYGGVLLFVDELYVKPAFRNRGFGTAFLNHIVKHCPDGTARICLEVSHRNTKARALYESLGFVARPYSTMTLEPSRPSD